MSIQAQSPTFSPYSRFGIGEIEKKGFGQITALGGSHIALVNDSTAPVFINAGNPASYCSIKLTTFEVGFQNTLCKYQNTTQSLTKNSTTLNYAAIAVPIRRRAGAAAGLLPFSNIGYNITDSKEIPQIGTVVEQYEGSGGLNQLFAGFAIQPFYKRAALSQMRKNLSNISIGANVSYIFGNTNNTARLIYPFGYGVYNTKRSKDTEVKDFYVNAGMQMHFDFSAVGKKTLKTPMRLTLGYTLSLPNKIRAYASNLNTTYIYGAYNTEYTRDTVLFENEVRGDIQLPITHGIGLGLKVSDKLTFLADFEVQQWSQFRYFNEPNLLKDSKRMSAGIQFVPNKYALGTFAYFKKMQYRIGGRYNDGSLEVKGKKIEETALSCGFGLPVGKFKSVTLINISLEIGKAGTIENNLIQQKFIRAAIGFTFNDRWFIKPKYD